MIAELMKRWNERMEREPGRGRKPRLVLIDDDPSFGALMSKTADKHAIDLDFFESVDGLGFINRLGEYDVILIDQQMDHISGMELAAYLLAFNREKTVILVSSTDVTQHGEVKLPSFISGFIHKDEGFYQVLKKSLSIHAG